MAAWICLLLFVAPVAALLALFVISAAQQGRKMRALCEEGIEVVAVVERNDFQPGYKIGGVVSVVSQPADRRRVIVYRFTDADGRSHVGRFTFTRHSAAGLVGHVAGDPFPIVYLPRSPTVREPTFLVALFQNASRGTRGAP